jgi:ABC-type Zn uptake system ZnuABC Zn-binding protein ZnuA
MRHTILPCLALTIAVATASLSGASAQDRLEVVTTLPDLRSIVEELGGDEVNVFAIATGYQNPHFVDPKPSFILKLSRADMFVTVGLDLEQAWVGPLLTSSRNPSILKGAAGYVDASIGVALLQPPASISREQGDIHVFGNPHYWLDPERGKQIARNVADGLTRVRPERAEFFETNLTAFVEQIDRRMKLWQQRMAPFSGTPVIAYHNEWPYFEERFGLRIVDFLEPRPGIPPTPSQLAKVITLMNAQDIRLIITSPYFQRDAADLVADRIGGEVIVLATSVGAEEHIKTYFDLFDYNVDRLSAALDTER